MESVEGDRFMTDPLPQLARSDADDSPVAGVGDVVVARRRALMLGAIATSAAFSIRPALAQAAGSVLNCEIPVPERGHGMFIDRDGKLVAADTPGAFPPSPRDFTGEEVRKALGGRSLPGTSPDQSRAYVNYIRRLQTGQSGFTCYASLQMPRR